MYDNKIRLSNDVLEKAEQIAAEWGLKNARAAVEAVFRRYSDEYLHGRSKTVETDSMNSAMRTGNYHNAADSGQSYGSCEALNELDDLLSL